jgi:peptidoglycan/xylan/chitin deacetylase (PgdA/CDA1 family)
VRRLLKTLASRAAFRTGITAAATRLGDLEHAFVRAQAPLGYGSDGQKFLVLAYHRVDDSVSEAGTSARASGAFAAQIDYLGRHFNVLPLGEIVAAVESRRSLPRRTVAVTFDDGYADNYLSAFPILQRYGLPATIFLTVESVESGDWMWFDRVMYAVRHTQHGTLSVGDGPEVALRNGKERHDAAVMLIEALKRVPRFAREQGVDEICAALDVGVKSGPRYQPLTWDQVGEMQANGITFGSHSMTHQVLAVEGREDALYEIARSKRLLEERLGTPVELFAYPNGKDGDYNAETVALLRRSGYRAAVTTNWGVNTGSGHLFELRRINPSSRTLDQFALDLARLYAFGASR